MRCRFDVWRSFSTPFTPTIFLPRIPRNHAKIKARVAISTQNTRVMLPSVRHKMVDKDCSSVRSLAS